jgi:hypothetical protein
MFMTSHHVLILTVAEDAPRTDCRIVKTVDLIQIPFTWMFMTSHHVLILTVAEDAPRTDRRIV